MLLFNRCAAPAKLGVGWRCWHPTSGACGDRIVRVRLAGILAELLVKIDPDKYGDKVTIEGGQKVTHAVLRKALHGALISSLLFWRDLSGYFRKLGFEPNPYDPCCVMNKMCDRRWTASNGGSTLRMVSTWTCVAIPVA